MEAALLLRHHFLTLILWNSKEDIFLNVSWGFVPYSGSQRGSMLFQYQFSWNILCVLPNKESHAGLEWPDEGD